MIKLMITDAELAALDNSFDVTAISNFFFISEYFSNVKDASRLFGARSALTGESLPVTKYLGDGAYSVSTCKQGRNCNRKLLYLLDCHWAGNRNHCHIWDSSQGLKKHNQDFSTTPSWVVRLDDDEDEEDAEFFGAPVEEYLMHKLEPREDVLSPVISKAMNPKRTPGDKDVLSEQCPDHVMDSVCYGVISLFGIIIHIPWIFLVCFCSLFMRRGKASDQTLPIAGPSTRPGGGKILYLYAILL
ncbi:hypothetical protein SO802_022422 [Lithocarpus litseifolius]|uniref:Uncharacterized protein n=1 Tax=Lithocarpus litseifolius TaxID=425828 RepID=A0AAW2CIV8_9ROSI